jgi:type II secretory pathway component PulM
VIALKSLLGRGALNESALYRIAIVCGLAALALSVRTASLRRAADTAAAETGTMRRDAEEILRLRAAGAAGPATGGSAVSSLEGAADAAGFRSGLSELKRSGADAAQARFENVPFHRLLWWIDDVKRKTGMTVRGIDFERTSDGRVNAEVTLR